MVFYRIVYPAIRARGDSTAKSADVAALQDYGCWRLSEAFGLGADEAEKSRRFPIRTMARSGVYRRAFVSLDTTEDGKRPNQKGLAFMANIKSQKKRIITNEKRRMRNRAVKSELKTAVRHVKDAVAEGNGKDAYAFACEACRLMDKAASKGVIHKNQAANRKSGIMRLANTVVTAEDIAAYEKPAPKPQKTGSKKAEAKAARKAAMAAASEEKAKRREKQLKEEKKAAERKAKEAEEAAKAEAEEASAEEAAE